MLQEQGIHILQSAPHTPQQNSRAERFMCTVMDKSEAMCHEACIPKNWWEFLIAHATHVYNCTPLRRHNWRTPFEVLHGSQPDIAHLRVFGCAAYVYLPEDVWANKMAPKSELMVYIGVAPGNESNFLFMRSSNNVLFTSAHALSDKAHFPRCAKPTRTQPTAQVTPPVAGECGPLRPPPPADDDDYRPRSPAARPPSPPPVPPHTPSPCPATPMPPALHKQRPAALPAIPPAPACPQCERRVPHQPSNVYGDDQYLVEQVKEIERKTCWHDIIGESRLSNWLEPQMPGNLPGTSIAPPAHTPMPPTASDSEDDVEWLCSEGGADLAAFLMSKAIPIKAVSAETKPIHKWTYRDILKLPAAAQEEWKATC